MRFCSLEMLLDFLCRHESHTQIYIKRCQKLGIATHARALSKIPVESSDGSVTSTKQFYFEGLDSQANSFNRLQQSTLDSIVTQEPKQPLFTTNGLFDYLIEFVVHEDEVCDLLISG